MTQENQLTKGSTVRVIDPNDALYWEIGIILDVNIEERKCQVRIIGGQVVWYPTRDLEEIL